MGRWDGARRAEGLRCPLAEPGARFCPGKEGLFDTMALDFVMLPFWAG